MSPAGARLQLTLLAAAIALGPNCVPVQRNARTSVRGDLAYERASDRDFSCEGDEQRQTQPQFGGELELRSETARSRYGAARVAALAGSLDEASGFDPLPQRSPYAIFALGGNIGWDFDHFGHELGATVLVSPGVAFSDGLKVAVPYYRLRLGSYDGLAGEFQVGPSRGFLFDRRAAAAGVRWSAPGLELHAGAALGGSIMLDQRSGHARELLVGSYAGEYLEGLAYVDVAVAIAPRLHLTLAAQSGERPGLLRLGLRYDLEPEAPPVIAPSSRKAGR